MKAFIFFVIFFYSFLQYIFSQNQSEMFNTAVCAFNNEDYKTATNLYRKLISLKNDTNYFDAPNIISLKVNLGNCYSETRQIDSALVLYTEAKDLLLTNYPDYPEWISAIYKNIALLYERGSDFSKALYFLEKAIDLCEKDDFERLSELYRDIGNLHCHNSKYQDALICFSKSQNFKKYYSAKDLTSLYINFYIAYKNLRDLNNAKIYLDLALKEYTNTGNTNKDVLAIIHNNYGNYYNLIGEKEKSINHYKNAIHIYNKIYNERHPYLSECYNELGETYFDLKDYKNSKIEYQRALISNSFQFSNNDFSENSTFEDAISKTYYPIILENKAQLLFKTGDIKNAAITIKDALKASEKAIDFYYYEESKNYFVSDHRDICILAADIFYKKYLSDKSKESLQQYISYVENSRNHIIKEKVRINEILIKDFPDSIRNSEQMLSTDINSLKYRLYNHSIVSDPDTEKIMQMKDELFALEEKHEAMCSELKSKSEKLRSFSKSIETPELNKIVSKLGKDQCILQYLLKPDGLYSVYISIDSVATNYNEIDSTFFKQLDFVIKHISSYKMIVDESEYNDFIRSSAQLYKYLIYPYNHLIKEKQLIIIPDDKLNYLSFDILISDTNALNSLNYKIPSYLIKTNSITYLPALSLLREPSTIKKNLLKKAVFAPVEFQDNEKLKNSEEEAKTLSSEMNFVPFILKQATESKFKECMKDYEIVHLATHSKINNEMYLYSGIDLTSDSANDGTLHLFEVILSGSSNKLIVLNACETAIGEEINGEGLMNFSRWFIFNGTDNIIASLWNINDKSGFDIFPGFYRYLFDGVRSDKALQDAKLDYIKNSEPAKDHPYFWAGHSLFSSNNLTVKLSNNYLYFIGAVAIIVVLAMFLLFRKRT